MPLAPPLVIVCDWIPPAYGAVGQYEFARALEAAAQGRRVVLIGLGSSASIERLSVRRDAHGAPIAEPRGREANGRTSAGRAPASPSPTKPAKSTSIPRDARAEAPPIAASNRTIEAAAHASSAHGDGADAAAGELDVIRLAARPAEKSKLVRRALWALDMNRRLFAATRRVVRRLKHSELKITGSPPFFSYLVLARRGGLRGASITYRITDFYPETAFVAGKGVWLKPLEGRFHALRRRADRIEALSDCQRRRLIDSGVEASRISIVRDASPVVIDDGVAPAARPFDRSAFVLLYSGNLGVAHEWETFAAAYRAHIRAGGRVRLWLNATGVGADALEAYCQRETLPLHRSPPAPLEALAGVLKAADGHLVLLRRDFWGYVFPSKVYGCLDAGQPIVFIGPEESDVHALIRPRARHASIRNGDVAGAERALETLALFKSSAETVGS